MSHVPIFLFMILATLRLYYTVTRLYKLVTVYGWQYSQSVGETFWNILLETDMIHFHTEHIVGNEQAKMM